MSIISQNTIEKHEINTTIFRFLHQFKVSKLLSQSNAYKQKGIAVIAIFHYLLSIVFSNRSMYMQMATGSFDENFSKNSVYRFFNDSRINWKKFTTLLANRIITTFMKPLTNENRQDVFIIDDSLFNRSRSKRTELVSTVFDHCSRTYKRGFRLLTLGWSDGNSFVPINSCLLASNKDKNVHCEATPFDGRTLAGKRRKQARGKAPEVMLDLIDSAKNTGLNAKYVLFDSWFSSPKAILALKERDLDTIAMVKKSSKIKYEFNGKHLNIKQIYHQCKKRPGRSKYLLSVDIMVGKDNPIPAKIVYVRNKSKKKDWLALISTDTTLSEEEIIRIYGKRWDIEVFFKICKSYLNLSKECRSLSYDAMTAHVALVFTRYMMLSIEKRSHEDDRSMGELFYLITDELADITFNKSMTLLMQALLDTLIDYFQLSDDEIENFMIIFMEKLPKHLQTALLGANAA